MRKKKTKKKEYTNINLGNTNNQLSLRVHCYTYIITCNIPTVIAVLYNKIIIKYNTAQQFYFSLIYIVILDQIFNFVSTSIFIYYTDFSFSLTIVIYLRNGVYQIKERILLYAKAASAIYTQPASSPDGHT